MNSSFSTRNPLLQLAWDATSLSALKECPRKYYYTIVLAKRSLDENIHLTFGILYHEAHELYDRLIAGGTQHSVAMREVVKRTLMATWDAERKRPSFVGDSYKNRFTLLRSIIWHLDQFQNDHAETIILSTGRAAVELSFRYQTTYSTKEGEPIVWCGHIDRLVKMGGMPYVLDYKTTKYNIDAPEFFGFYSPDNQMSGYSFAGRIVYDIPVNGVIIDAAQVLVGGTRFKRGFAHRTEGVLAEWYDSAGYYFALAEQYAKRNYWPLNETACGRYGGCPFRSICSLDPRVREAFLKVKFTTKPWDPLKVRSEV